MTQQTSKGEVEFSISIRLQESNGTISRGMGLIFSNHKRMQKYLDACFEDPRVFEILIEKKGDF